MLKNEHKIEASLFSFESCSEVLFKNETVDSSTNPYIYVNCIRKHPRSYEQNCTSVAEVMGSNPAQA